MFYFALGLVCMQFNFENSGFQGLCKIFKHITQAITFFSKQSQHHDVSNQKDQTSHFFLFIYLFFILEAI